MEYFIRGLIAVVVFVLLFLAIPLIISLVGLPVPSAAISLIYICIVGILLAYVYRGKVW